MDNLIIKTSEQIKNQMYVWFLQYYHQTIDNFDGTELFTFFDRVAKEKKDAYLNRITLELNEQFVFILLVKDNEVIINTTHRFIRLSEDSIENLYYSDFEWHNGFTRIYVISKETNTKVSIKHDGYISEFRLKKRNGKIIYWNIPTGNAGFAFWNVTKKCELIGRKYKCI